VFDPAGVAAPVFVAIVARDVFAVVWFALVAAPVGNGSAAALTGIATPPVTP
jgi:hypothetical protein